MQKMNTRYRKKAMLLKNNTPEDIVETIISFDPDYIRFSNSLWIARCLKKKTISLSDLTPENSFVLDVFRGIAKRESRFFPRKEWFLYKYHSFCEIKHFLKHIVISGYQEIGFQAGDDGIKVYGSPGSDFNILGEIRADGVFDRYNRCVLGQQDNMLYGNSAIRDMAFLKTKKAMCDGHGWHTHHKSLEEFIKHGLFNKKHSQSCIDMMICLLISDTESGTKRLSNILSGADMGMKVFDKIWRVRRAALQLNLKDAFLKNLFIVSIWAKHLSMGHRMITICPVEKWTTLYPPTNFGTATV